ASHDRLDALFHLIAFRGLRRGEGIGLPWDDVDLDRAELAVNWQIVQLGYATETAAPKAASVGIVALDSQTVAVLRLHRRRQQAERERWGSAWTDTGLVFTREDGAALHPEYVSRHFARLVRTADLPPIRLHDLRHGAASLALAGGADLKVVSDMLRHSSITITADTYTSVLPDTARAAAEAAVAIVPRRNPVPAATDDELAAPVPAATDDELSNPAPAATDDELSNPVPAATDDVLAAPVPAATDDVLAAPVPHRSHKGPAKGGPAPR
ncbi:MAG: site-specific integrase, partial [Mycobacteriales bacterium]